MTHTPIYLDYAATTPLQPEVLDAMMPFLTAHYGNPSSVYALGRKTKHVVEKCRITIADILGVPGPSILFTSGGTESNNSVFVQGHPHVISNRIEHESVRESIKNRFTTEQTTWVAPTSQGHIEVDDFEMALAGLKGASSDPVLASFMAVNNELGSINPIADLAALGKKYNVEFHTDAVQAAGVLALSELAHHVQYLSLSGHKMGGPKGIGVLVAQPVTPLRSLVYGGGQEQDRRAGTENVAGIVGFTKALELAHRNREATAKKLHSLRDALTALFRQTLPDQIQFNSPMEGDYSPHILNILCLDKRGKGLDGEMLILGLDMVSIYVSAGSACSSGTVKVSPVLTEMGIPYNKAKGAVRISLHESQSESEILEAGRRICTVVSRMSSI